MSLTNDVDKTLEGLRFKTSEGCPEQGIFFYQIRVFGKEEICLN